MIVTILIVMMTLTMIFIRITVIITAVACLESLSKNQKYFSLYTTNHVPVELRELELHRLVRKSVTRRAVIKASNEPTKKY